MRLFSAVLKSIAFLTVLGGCFALWVGGLPLANWSVARRWRWRSFAFRQWARANAALLGMRVEAANGAPREPIFLVANHLSYLDLIVLVLQLDAVFVAKSEIAQWPWLGFLSRCMGTIFIERQRKRDILRVNALIETALRHGHSVVLFPEGTTSAGAGVLPFKSPLLEPAIKLGIAVHYASLHYETRANEPPASEAICWWGEMDFVPHLWRLFQLKGWRAAVHFGLTPVRAADRKTLARGLHAAVTQTFVPVLAAHSSKTEETTWLNPPHNLPCP